MSENSFAFRRLTDPFMLTVAPTAQRFDVPVDLKAAGYTSFCVVNPNAFWVRLKGSNGTYSSVTTTTGWMLPPGFFGVFSTQYPDFMSAMSVTAQGLTAGSGVLEVSYGGGA